MLFGSSASRQPAMPSGEPACRKSCLQVEPAGVCRNVEYFPGEIQSVYELRFHGPGVDLSRVNAACRYNCFGKRPMACYG